MNQVSASNSLLLEAECWVFDLDNTLYPASSNLFAQVDQKMTSFISDFLELSMAEAVKIRKAYYRDHGTTLNGLMTLHGLEPGDYLDFVHDIDLGVISPNVGLDRSLSRLAGRKIIFTNGPTDHAERVLERISIRHHFDAVFDIISAGYVPKPEPKIYHALVERYGLTPSKTVMVEDLARNLEPAAALGMTTVLVCPKGDIESQIDREIDGAGKNIDHVVEDLSQWLRALTAPSY